MSDGAAASREPREFRSLALSGGGSLGLQSAAVLAALEEPIGRRFKTRTGIDCVVESTDAAADRHRSVPRGAGVAEQRRQNIRRPAA